MDSPQIPSRSAEPTFAQEGTGESLESLLEALRQTMEGISESASGSDHEKVTARSLAGIYEYHSGRDVMTIEVVTDIVKALAISNFPNNAMAPVIDRWASEAAGVLLENSVARDRLASLWARIGVEVENAG